MLLFILLLVFIGLAVVLAWFLIAHDHGEKEPVLALWQAAGLGLTGAVAAALIESRLVPVHNLDPGAPYGSMLGAALMVGAIEEICKFLPLALLIYKKRYFNEHTDGIIYFALAGLGFGLPENLLYTLQFGSRAGLTRLVLTPMLHAATTGTIGYFLIKRKLARQSPLVAAVPLLLMIILHGLYDFGLTSGVAAYQTMSLLITLSVSAGLFFLFSQATQNDQAKGLSVVGHNNFCRACGWANPRHHLYCVHCGQHA
ncbi:MAG TPA: PrsW family intramembrane metalloprotease [Candidatus Saccharimonadales bacterium]|nr:PrsW family intramembrane metalloprotease [Candidatus Saccharimonadales bacterium]